MTGNTLLPAVGNLLQRCVLQVHRKGTGAFVGNAFFIQPNLVATCAHVLRDAGGRHPDLFSWPRSYWPNGAPKPPVPTALVIVKPEDEPTTGAYPFPDLAVIRVAVPAVDWVLLGTADPDPGTRVFARGVSEHTADNSVISGPASPDGLTLEVAGYSGGFLRVRADRVERGMSGTPVLEPHTGRVIGMVKASRHLELEIGGFILPVSAIRPHLDGILQRQYEEEAQRRWHTALHTPLPQQPWPPPPTPVNHAAYHLVARESLSHAAIGASLLLALVGGLILANPPDGSTGVTGLLSLALVGCATTTLALTSFLLLRLARWFRALSENLKHGLASAHRKALRWTIAETAICIATLLVMPKRPLPTAIILVLLAIALGALFSLRRRAVREWCQVSEKISARS
jgi:hypothetical protein